MTPESFQAAALAWIGVATVVLTALTFFAVKAVGWFYTIKSQIEEARDRVSRQSHRMDNQQAQITSIALKTPAPIEPVSFSPIPPETKNPPFQGIQK